MFSRRLDDAWLAGDNPLAAAERRRRPDQGNDAVDLALPALPASLALPALIDLTGSNPTAVDVALPDRGEALAGALADPSVSRYQPAPLGPDEARALIAGEHAHWGATIAPAQIALSASSSESYAWLLKLLCDPGDVIVVPTPSYPLFDFLAALEGVQLRHYQLVYAGHWQIDQASLAAALALPGARAVVVVNPNNPTGSFITRSELANVARLAADNDAALIVDEVFAPYAFARPSDAPASVTTVSELPALTFALGGLSKGYGLPQFKLGWMAALGPPVLVRGALARLETIADTYLSVGTPVLRALPRLLALGAEIRADIAARILENRRTLATAVAGTPVTWLPSEGGWAAILRMPAVATDEAWALALLQEDGVLVAPGYFFDLDDAAVGTTLVVSLLPPPAQFAVGIDRIVKRAARLTP